jgi:SAM-dependent methyltransferase
MAFKLDHWNDPRGSIANKYVNNDFAYVTRGANIALYILQKFDLKPSEAKKLTVLDYGCGTGRAALFLASVFGKVVGYDPNTYCIAEAFKENDKSDSKPSNLILTSSIDEVPVCDLAFSTNVIEHLTPHDAKIMIDNLKQKNTGETLLWYAPVNNALLEPHITSSLWSEKLAAAHRGGKIQIDFFDFN